VKLTGSFDVVGDGNSSDDRSPDRISLCSSLSFVGSMPFATSWREYEGTEYERERSSEHYCGKKPECPLHCLPLLTEGGTCHPIRDRT
jgi:hypothetical protein